MSKTTRGPVLKTPGPATNNIEILDQEPKPLQDAASARVAANGTAPTGGRRYSPAQRVALAAADRLTAAGHLEFDRIDLLRASLGPGSSPAARMAFARTVSALIRSGGLSARVDEATLAELAAAGRSAAFLELLRGGDIEALASRRGGQLALLSLPIRGGRDG